ncbi:flagellar protein FlaG [Paenibacillus ihuae]|uniref:flagellar protein FlaG n=1 Tax=Paenibacillus ihuae TaxID=1232431 RepID=UPI0006D59DD6|nr:flagellar protein FlaG [Paenibacillus ihuae]
MNVQFSLSAAAASIGNQSKVESGVSTVNMPIPASDSPIIRDVKDLGTKERQGVNVSIADEQLIRTIERAVKSLQGPQTTLEISIHEKTHDIMVKVMNKETGELIREVPPEKTLDLVAKMMEIAGLLIDERI